MVFIIVVFWYLRGSISLCCCSLEAWTSSSMLLHLTKQRRILCGTSGDAVGGVVGILFAWALYW